MKRRTFLRALAALPFVPSSLAAVQEELGAKPLLECPDCQGRGVYYRSRSAGIVARSEELTYLPRPAGPTMVRCERCGGTGELPWDDHEVHLEAHARAACDEDLARELEGKLNRAGYAELHTMRLASGRLITIRRQP